MFKIQWVQHPVGHGGFHTGHLRTDDGDSFHWAFDCGSRRSARFDEYLEAWSRRVPCALDWLFISHFDTDHVSGLNTLLSRVVVKNVMVPYLNERELAYVLLHEIARDNLDRSIVEITADPSAFFVSRGADSVYFLRGRQSDAELGEVPYEPLDRKGERDWATIITRPKITFPLSSTEAKRKASAPGAIIDGGECDIRLHAQSFSLRLKPYRAPIQRHALRGLIQRIESLVGAKLIGARQPGLGPLAYAVAAHARTATGRAALRGLFKQFVGSSNRASLSLLSIPEAHQKMSERWDCAPRPWWRAGKGPAAWVNTGDAELLRPADLTDWARCYQTELPQIRVLSLPHHGSDKNSDAAFQNLCPDASLVAHVRSTSKKHPGNGVVATAGDRLVSVTEESGTAISLYYRAC